MNNFSVLPFYSSVAEQNHRLPYAYGAVYPLYCDDTRILPFQIIRPTRQNTITSVILFDKDGTQVRDLTSDMSFDIVALEDYDVIVYTAQFGYAQELPIGQYYISVSDGAQTWYSDIFTIVSDITPYVKLEWYDEENFVMDAGTIVYNNPRFINRLYLNTEIGKPDYQFEEEGEQRDGYFFPEKQLSEKTYRFTILAPEYLCDVMRFIRMADHIQITADGYTYNADTFLITPKWQTQGDLASVEVEFESNTVAKKLGDARVRRTIGDFNDDYNDDYDGGDTPVPPVPPTPTEAPENDVNFYDYDGFRVAAYSIAEAKALTELPTPPQHEGLTFQQWNWTLNDIQTYNRRYIDVGANYITTDGATHIKVTLQTPTLDTSIYLYWGNGTLTVDWGDGTTQYTGSKTTFAGEKITHTYAQMGDYEIKISFVQSADDGSYGVVNKNQLAANWNNNLRISEVNCGDYVNLGFTGGGFSDVVGLKISIATTTQFSPTSNFINSIFKNIAIPRNGFTGAVFLSSDGIVCYPKQVTSLGGGNWSTYYSNLNGRKILPEYTTGTPTNNLGYNFRVLSIPNSLNITPAIQPTTEIIDIVDGFVPSGNWTLNGSYLLLADGLVDFFTKLGTTQTSITLTLGSQNLNRLTADQKAIATNKGYTLA